MKKKIIKALFIANFIAWLIILGIIAIAVAICLLAVYAFINLVIGFVDYINWSSANYYPYIARYGRRNAYIYYCMDNE